jgi:hypothetical protein
MNSLDFQLLRQNPSRFPTGAGRGSKLPSVSEVEKDRFEFGTKYRLKIPTGQKYGRI